MSIKKRDLKYFIHKIFKSWRVFRFQGRNYQYFCHRYNFTWMNERAVEVPVIWEMVKKYHGKKILEVGNVLSHYFSFSHDILDKYEKGEGVINQDIVGFKPAGKYDLIVSISTLEHVGWDENPRDPGKVLRAVENLRNCLVSKGKMIITLPLGYNPPMDELLGERGIPFSQQYFLKRISRDNKWKEVEWKDVCGAKFSDPFPNANGLVIGIVEKE